MTGVPGPDCRSSIRRSGLSRLRRPIAVGALGALCVLVTVALVAAPTRGAAEILPGLGGVWLIGLLGLVDGEDDIDALVRKVRRVQAGEDDVTFATDRDGDVGRLYDAVGELAETATDGQCGDADSEAYRQELYEITSAEDVPVEERVRRLLDLGRRYLDVENGHVTRIDLATDHHEITTAVGSDVAQPGTTSDVSETVCRMAVETEGPLAVHDATDDGRTDERAVEAWDVNSYIGAKLTVDGDLYGTVCFVDRESHEEPFTSAQKAFVDLLARWISQFYERQAFAAEVRLKDRAMAAAPIGVAIADAGQPDNPLVYVNDAFEAITGYDADDALGRNCRFLQGPATDDESIDRMREAIAAGETVTVELRNYRADGTEFWNRVRISPVTDGEGTVTHYVGFQEDVTEQRERRRETRRTSERLGATIEASPAAIICLDTEQRITLWNPAAERMFGWTADEVRGESLPTIPEEYADDFERIQDRVRAGETVEGVETKRRRRDGDLIDVRISSAPTYEDGEVSGDVAVIEDVTERKERERELERYKAFTDDLLDAIDDVFYVVDEDGRLQRWNESLVEASGLPEDELDGIDVAEFFDAEQQERFAASLQDVLETGETRMKLETAGPGDTVTPYEFVAVTMEDLDGDTVVVGIGRDISERREKERRLSRVISNVPGLVYRARDEPGWPTEFVSEGVRDVTGYGPEALESGDVNWTEDVVAAEPEAPWDRMETALAAGEPYEVTYPIETADGERRWLKEHGRGVDGGDDETVIEGVAVDVTERVEYERELERTQSLLEQSQRLAGVGAWEIEVADGRPVGLSTTDEALCIHDLPPDADLSIDDARSYYHPADRQRVSDAVETAIETGEGDDLEARLQTADGDQRWIRYIADPVTRDGEVVAIRGSIQDITDRKEREQELERTTTLLARAEEMADVGGWSVDVSDGEPSDVTWTDKLYDVFELPESEEPPVYDIFEYYHPDDRKRHQAALRAGLETGEAWDQELRLLAADGSEKWVRNIGEPITEDGEVVEINGSIQDVTERKEREDALRERERALQAQKDYTDAILDAVEDVFYVVDDEGDIRRWNETLREVSGYTDAEIADLNALDLFAAEDQQAVADALERVFAEPGSQRVEARAVTKDGAEIPFEFVGATVENPDGETVVAGIGRDVTERNRREAALERATELLGQAQRIASVGGWELDLETDEMTVTDEFRRIHGLDPKVPVELEDVLDYYHPDDVDYIRQRFEAAVEYGESYDMEVRLRTAQGCVRWVRALAEPIERDGDVVALRGSVQDITAEKEREQALESLHGTAEGLLQTETEDAVAALVVETAEDVLDVTGVCLYLLDPDANRLDPAACTEGFAGSGGDVPPVAVGDEDDPIWNSFATGSRRVIDAGDDAGGLVDGHAGGALVVPVGDHGVMAVTAGRPGISAQNRRLLETLVATTETALDRLESEAAVRERDEELAARNRRLRRQIQVTDVIRRVDQTLIGADSREAIESAVTDQLAAADDVTFAWISAVEAAGDRLVPRAWAGSGESYLDAVSLGLDGEEPAARTARTGEPTVVSNAVAELGREGWRKSALDSGFQSALAVPIGLDEYRYGVLAVYADEAEVFGDLEREVFAELGRTIASAINAVQTREALHADALLELRLSLTAPDTFLAQVAGACDCEVEYVGTAARSGETARLFFSTDADASDALADLVTVSEFRLLSETDGNWVYEAAVSGEALPAKLLRHGASPESIRATPAAISAVVHVPTGTAVREFVEMLRDSYRSVELESRRDVERPTRTRQQVVGDLLSGLTDRQREVLRTAYYAGFFDWPRETTGEELAEMLDVTQPTVSRHLRLAQRHLLSRLFEEEVVDVAA